MNMRLLSHRIGGDVLRIRTTRTTSGMSTRTATATTTTRTTRTRSFRDSQPQVTHYVRIQTEFEREAITDGK